MVHANILGPHKHKLLWNIVRMYTNEGSVAYSYCSYISNHWLNSHVIISQILAAV